MLLPFIKDGLDRGEKTFHIVDPKLRIVDADNRAEYLKRLADARIHVQK